MQATLLLYAPPHSLAAILTDAVNVLDGGRQCVVARELTKVIQAGLREQGLCQLMLLADDGPWQVL